MIKKLKDEVFKLSLSSNIYFLNYEKKIIIDTGDRCDRQEISNILSKIVDFEKVEIVILTHMHYDHTGNLDLFPNAKFYASKEAIDDLKKNPYGAVLNEQIVSILENIQFEELPQELFGLKIIPTPGHTRGSVCLYLEKEMILFSGDTIFDNGYKGRIDLPTSAPNELQKSIIKLLDYKFKTLCPGHDY